VNRRDDGAPAGVDGLLVGMTDRSGTAMPASSEGKSDVGGGSDVRVERSNEASTEHVEVSGEQPQVSFDHCQVHWEEAAAAEVTGLVGGD
jgi:hypothetical protein